MGTSRIVVEASRDAMSRVRPFVEALHGALLQNPRLSLTACELMATNHQVFDSTLLGLAYREERAVAPRDEHLVRVLGELFYSAVKRGRGLVAQPGAGARTRDLLRSG